MASISVSASGTVIKLPVGRVFSGVCITVQDGAGVSHKKEINGISQFGAQFDGLNPGGGIVEVYSIDSTGTMLGSKLVQIFDIPFDDSKFFQPSSITIQLIPEGFGPIEDVGILSA